MPEGIILIDWDPFEGAIISAKYPETLDLPDNIVQLLQVSQTFSPGILEIKEKSFHAVTLGNEEKQMVVVLVLNKYEDSEDFYEFISTINDVVSSVEDKEERMAELKRLYGLSKSVFKVREAVLVKLAEDITQLKNWEADIKQSLHWFMENDPHRPHRVLFALILYNSLTKEELQNKLNLEPEELDEILKELKEQQLIEKDKQSEKYECCLKYLGTENFSSN